MRFGFLAPPDISVEKTWIHAADGCEVELVCTLLGDLSSDVSNFYVFMNSNIYDDYDYDSIQIMWYQNSFLLDMTDRRSIFSRGNKFILGIRNFHQTDFGNYRFLSIDLILNLKFSTEKSFHSF